MVLITKILVVLVAALHVYIMYFEMFAWDTIGKKLFGKSLPAEVFPHTKTLAANQGLYNGFLAAGLIWSLFITDTTWQKNIAVFFLTCILIAGIYGGFTASRRIFTSQALPAALALLSLLLL